MSENNLDGVAQLEELADEEFALNNPLLYIDDSITQKPKITTEEVEQWLSDPIFASEDMYPDDQDKLEIHDAILEQEYQDGSLV